MSRLGNLFDAHLGASERKQRELELEAQRKKDYLDPEFKFNVNDVNVVDADTVELPTGERVRLSAEEGFATDAYETDPDAYVRNPLKEAAHRKSYAEAFGLDQDDVTREDLVIAGESQKAKFRDRLAQSADAEGNISFRNRGEDQFGRTLGEVSREQLDLTGRFDNAGYEGAYNPLRRLEDFASGETAEHYRGSEGRGVGQTAKDQVVNFATGAGRMANDLIQSAGVLTGVNNIPGVDEAHSGVRDALEAFKEWGASPAQLRRERLDQQRNELQSEFYNVQKEKYKEQGNGEFTSSVRAGIDEFVNAVGNITDNPGGILDKTVESLPYMLGVAGAGRAAVNTAAKALQKKVLLRGGVQKNISKGLAQRGRPGTKGKFQTAEGLEEQAAWHTARFLETSAGKKYVNRVATSTGIATVGVTEGMSTAADVYDSIINMSEEDARNSDAYLAFREQGMSHEKALNELAEDAHLQTLGTVMAAAAAFSAATGAGAFEGQLLSGLAGVRSKASQAIAATTRREAAEKVQKVAAEKGKGAIRRTVEAGVRGGVKVGKYLGGPGLKEAAEELGQSGGGELLSQFAKAPITGEEVGPGVGRAAGEGAVIGFASGAGIQGTLGSLKKLGTASSKGLSQAYHKYKKRGEKPVAVNASDVRQDTTTVSQETGTPVENAEDVPVGGVNESTVETTETSPLDEVGAAINDAANPDNTEFVSKALRVVRGIRAARAQGLPIPPEQQAEAEMVIENGRLQLQAYINQEIDSIPEEEREVTPKRSAELEVAGELGAEITGMSKAEKQAYDRGVALRENLQESDRLHDQQQAHYDETTEETDPEKIRADKKRISTVHHQKFGDVKSPKGFHGLGYFNRRMRELMAVTSPGTQNDELSGLMTGLNRFKESQNAYLNNARKAVEATADVGNVKWTPPKEDGTGGTPALLQILENEQVVFDDTVQKLRNRVRDWRNSAPKATPQNAAGPSKAPQNKQAAKANAEEIRKTKEQTVKYGDLDKSLTSILKSTPRGSQERSVALTNLQKRHRTVAEENGGQRDIDLDKRISDASKQNETDKKNPEIQRANAEAQQGNAAPDTPDGDADAEVRDTVTFSLKNGRTFIFNVNDPEQGMHPEGKSVRVMEVDADLNNIGIKTIPLNNISTEAKDDIARALLADVQFEIPIGGLDTSKLSSISGVVDETQDTEQPAPATPERVTITQAVNNGAVSGLNYLAERANNRATKALAQRLAKVIGKRDVPVILMSGDQMVKEFGKRGARARGAYRNGKIYLNTGLLTSAGKFVNTFLHESVHAALDGHLKNGISAENKIRLNQLTLDVVRRLGKDDDPAAGRMREIIANNQEEMLTHAIGTPWFQNWLKSQESGKETLFDKFVKFISEMLGFSNTSLMGAVMSLTEDLLKEVEGPQATEAPQAQPEVTTEPAPETNSDPGVSTEELQAQREQSLKEERITEVKRLATQAEAGRLKTTPVLVDSNDQQFLDNLVNKGIPLADALGQLLLEIEPNPTLRKVNNTPKVGEVYIDQAGVQGAVLNERGNKKTLDAKGILDGMRDIGNIFKGSTVVTELALVHRKMGSKLSAMFEQRRKKTRDLISTADAIAEIMQDPASMEYFFEKVGTTPAEEQALRGFRRFYQLFQETLNNSMLPMDSESSLLNQIEKNPLYYFQNEDGTIDSRMVMAMALEAMQWMTGSGAQTTANSDDDIRAIFGIPDHEAITDEMRRVARWGTLRNPAAYQMGRNTFRHMNLKVKGGQRPNLEGIMNAGIGSQILLTLGQMKNREGESFIREVRISPEEWKALQSDFSRENFVAEGGQDVVLVGNNVGYTGRTFIDEFGIETAEKGDIMLPLREMIEEGKDIFTKLFDSNSNVRQPMFTVPQKQHISINIGNTVGEVPEAMQERMLTDAQRHYQMVAPVINFVNRFSTPEAYLKAGHGYLTEEEILSKHVTEREGLEGKNDALLRELLEGLNFHRRHGEKKFYIPTKMIRSGRIYLNTNTINPQQSKIHRFMVGREGWARNITKRLPSAMNDQQLVEYTRMMVAIGLGLGIKTDRKLLSDIVQEVEDYFANGDGQAALQALDGNEKFTAEQEAAVSAVLAKEGTHTGAALLAYKAWSDAAIGEEVEISLPNETDGITNGYILSLMATPPGPDGITPEFKRSLNAGGIFFKDDEHRTFAEYKAAGGLDGYQQLSKNSSQSLAKNLRLFKNYRPKAKHKINQRRKFYQMGKADIVMASGLTPTEDQMSYDAPLPVGVKDVARDWAKAMLMVLSYGAGMRSTVEAMVNGAIEKYYEKLGELSNEPNLTAQDVADGINRAYGTIIMVNESYKKFGGEVQIGWNHELDEPIFDKPKNYKMITAEQVTALATKYNGDVAMAARNFVLPKPARALLAEGLRNTYGQAVTEAANKMLGPVMNIRHRMNHANTFSNIVFVHEYNRQVAKREAAEKRALTPAEHRQIREALANIGLMPMIDTPDSQGKRDRLEMTNYANEYIKTSGKNPTLLGGWARLKKGLAHVTQGTWKPGGFLEETKPAGGMVTRIPTLQPDWNVGVSAFVKTIHAMDGVINSLAWSGPHAVINIHDAQLSPWWAATDVATGANMHFGSVLNGYDLPAQYNDMLQGLLNSILDLNDTRLDQGTRDSIASEFFKVIENHGEGLPNSIPHVDAAGNPRPAATLGREYLKYLRDQLPDDVKLSRQGKELLFGDVSSINQFAQADTAVTADGIELESGNTWADVNSESSAVEPRQLVDEARTSDVDAQFDELFEDRLEAEKVEGIWEGLSEYDADNGMVPSHKTHLGELMRNLVAPAIKSMAPILQKVVDENDPRAAEWEGEILRLNLNAFRLSDNADTTVQETAAAEYVTAIVHHAINGEPGKVDADHFVRKEVRRLYELAEANIVPADFENAKVGDPALRAELAQKRYDSIFNNEDPNVGYERFMALGLTNHPFAEALSRINNDGIIEQGSVWDKGIVRGMLSAFRRMVQRLAGHSQRIEGGNLSQAMRALAQSTIAVNQRNQQRLKDLATGADTTSRVQRANQALVNAVNDRFIEPFAKGMQGVARSRMKNQDPSVIEFLKTATHAALASRDEEIRDHYNKFYRELTTPYGIGKDNPFFQTMAEIMPWDEQNLNWMDLLRKSKVIVDMARQEQHDHTRSYLDGVFDPNFYRTKAQKMAMTRTILKTDIMSLSRGDQGLTMADLADLLRSRSATNAEVARLEGMLRTAVATEGQPALYNFYRNHTKSLANYMVHGKHLIELGSMNAHNIAVQNALLAKDRLPINDMAKIENLIDRLASAYALQQQSDGDLQLTNQVVQHEMGRDDGNGFVELVSMHINFQELSREKLFDNNPTQMIKGYVYEIFDQDISVEYVEPGSERYLELLDLGYQEIGEVPIDKKLDTTSQPRLIMKGLRGLATYNKSITSLTDLQHRGANLFSTAGYQSAAARKQLGEARAEAQRRAAKFHFSPDYQNNGENLVPVFDGQGRISDFRYMMSEKNKQEIMKKEDPYDRVLPRMFASITDRANTKEINRDVVRLLKQEWDGLKNSKAHRFIEISENAGQDAKEMWRLLPEDMKRFAKLTFGEDKIMVRDDVVNLVLGFRKATLTDIKNPDTGKHLWGKGTPVVRMAEKVWMEVISLQRIKIAILTPAVVVGNIASNMAMLLSEGIPLNYIQRHVSEAISAMRMYQKDQKALTELERKIGAKAARGENTAALERRFTRLQADMAANPVGQLVHQGLFTSITADLGVDDDTIRGSLIQKAEDALGDKGGKVGRAAKTAVKEAYMLPGSKGYKAAVAATQYGDFVARYTKFKYDTQVNKKSERDAINEALAAFIYYDIPQPRYLQALNDSGLVMFTKFFLRIQPIVARMYSQNPASAFSVLALQRGMLPQPFSENIMNYGMGDGLTHKPTAPWNIPGKAYDTLNPTEPALLQWLLNPFGL